MKLYAGKPSKLYKIFTPARVIPEYRCSDEDILKRYVDFYGDERIYVDGLCFKAAIKASSYKMRSSSSYIHRNPLRAGMLKRLTDYRWSSYKVSTLL